MQFCLCSAAWIISNPATALIAAFLDAEQLDEFIMDVIPRMIGEGTPLVAPRHETFSVTTREQDVS